MLKFFSMLTAIFLCASCAKEPPAAWVNDYPAASGETGFYRAEYAPFPHESRMEGYTRGGEFYSYEGHYSDNIVGVYIPDGYDPEKPLVFVYYIHGHRNNVWNAMLEFRLREMVEASRKNVILVFPEGPVNVPDSSGGKLEDQNGLKNLTEEIHAKLLLDQKITAGDVDEIILSGHSGAYKAIYHCLEKGGVEDKISEVYLLDASYGGLEEIANWIGRNRSDRFASIYTKHLSDENQELQEMLDDNDLEYRIVDEDTAFEHVLRDTPRIFIEANKSNHDQTVNMLEVLLTTSGVDSK